MRLADILTADRVTTSMEAVDKESALQIVAGLFPGQDQGEVYRVLREREALASTGIGSGVAIPHGRVRGLERLVAALAVCRSGVDFDSVDGLPVHIVVAILAPERSTGDHLKALARVSRVLRSEQVRDALVEAPSTDAALQTVLAHDERAG
jgi:PTS system nitrogen regulatory IIA component